MLDKSQFRVAQPENIVKKLPRRIGHLADENDRIKCLARKDVNRFCVFGDRLHLVIFAERFYSGIHAFGVVPDEKNLRFHGHKIKT